LEEDFWRILGYFIGYQAMEISGAIYVFGR
jgi:hypothetical protein